MSQTGVPSTEKAMPYHTRVLPQTVRRLEMLSAVFDQPIGHLIDQMVAKNYNHIKENGMLDAFMLALEESQEDYK